MSVAAVLSVAVAHMFLVVHAEPTLARFIVPAAIGLTFGALLSRVLTLRDRAHALAADLARREAEIREFNQTLERRVAERTAELEKKRAELLHSQRMEIIGRLASGVTHDFNNVLTAILSSASMLRSSCHAENSEQSALIDDIVSAGERAARLASQLLSLARRKPATPEIIDLGEMVNGVAPLITRLVAPRVNIQYELSPVKVRADLTQLEQLVLNLCTNAGDASADGGSLTVRVGTSSDGAPLLSVTDTGSGMNEATRARIFEPFFTTKALNRGTGLGLMIVREVAEAAGATVEVQSEMGQGSTFTVRFPAVGEAPLQ